MKSTNASMYHSLFSAKELQIIAYLDEGLLYKEMAERIGTTEGTIKQCCHSIYQKMEVGNRTEAVNKFYGRYQEGH